MKCAVCGYDDLGTGDSAHSCGNSNTVEFGGIKQSSTAPTVEVDEDIRIARHAVFNLKEFRAGRSTFPGEALGILERCLDRLASKPPAREAAERQSIDTRDAERFRYIEEHATTHGGGNGFTITCFVPVDEEDIGVGIDKARGAAPAAGNTQEPTIAYITPMAAEYLRRGCTTTGMMSPVPTEHESVAVHVAQGET